LPFCYLKTPFRHMNVKMDSCSPIACLETTKLLEVERKLNCLRLWIQEAYAFDCHSFFLLSFDCSFVSLFLGVL
jgi:hypothetical protein